MFEGRDGAGKGGTIKAITERVSPRVFRVVALPAPTEREKSQMYVQRYLPHLPAAGEIVIFDRSWYNRAGVERVMGFCTEEQVASASSTAVPLVEKAIVDSGIILLKYWLEVSPEEQTRRLEGAHRRRPQDLEALADGPEVVQPLVRLFARARRRCSPPPTPSWAPWYVAHSDDKKRARLNIITHLLEPDSLQGAAAREGRSCRSGRSAAATGSPTIRSSSSPRSTEHDTPMNRTLCTLAVAAAFIAEASAQQYVYPAKGQSAEKQKSDEAACYTWAVQQSGFDPAKPPPAQAAAAPPTTATGTTPGAGLRGAAGGAVVGGLMGDSGTGAAAGAVVARSQSRRQNAAGAQQAQQQQQTATQQQQAAFGKARAACLEGRGYTVK